MTFKPFWDKHLVDEVVELTNGSLVDYRGQKFWMHCESPTPAILESFSGDARGVANILIGSRSRFPENVERGELITVDGNDWVIADWQNSEDGDDIYIALSRTTRTEF